MNPRGSLPCGDITPAQVEVWRGIALGKTTKQMAHERGTGVKTIGKHREEVYRKLKLSSVADITRAAVQFGVIAIKITPLIACPCGALLLPSKTTIPPTGKTA
jgi:DNA-binding NarL/FixJ family response regulator